MSPDVDERSPWRSSESTSIRPVVTADATKSFRTRSSRIRGLRAAGGREAERRDVESLAGQRKYRSLGRHLGACVGSERSHLARLVTGSVRTRPVDACARSEHKPARAGGLCHLCQPQRLAEVDFICQLGKAISHRVVRDRRQVNDVRDAFEIFSVTSLTSINRCWSSDVSGAGPSPTRPEANQPASRPTSSASGSRRRSSLINDGATYPRDPVIRMRTDFPQAYAFCRLEAAYGESQPALGARPWPISTARGSSSSFTSTMTLSMPALGRRR